MSGVPQCLSVNPDPVAVAALPAGAWTRHARWLVLVPCLAALPSLLDPPYGDNLTGAFPQAVWLAHHGFDVFGLLGESGFRDGGPRVYPTSVYPYFVGALYAAGLAPAAVFVVMHLVSIVSAGLLLVSFRARLARVWDETTALVVALALGSSPLFASLTAQTNMDMPLAAATWFALVAASERRAWASFLAAALAVHLKTSGILAVVACSACWAASTWRARADPNQSARCARIAFAHFALLALAAGEAWLSSASGSAAVYFELGGGWRALLTERAWLVPQFGVLLAIAVLASPFWLARELREPARDGSRAALVFVAAMLLFYGQYTNVLARYFLQGVPVLAWFSATFAARWPAARRVVRGVAVLAIACGVVDRHGALRADAFVNWKIAGSTLRLRRNDPHMLERTMRYRDDLALNRAVARRAEEWANRGYVLVAAWPLTHVLGMPELGYAERALPVAAPVHELTFDADRVGYRTLYSGFTRGARQLGNRKIVWVLKPSVGSGAWLGVRRGDQLLEKVECRGRTALFVRRRAWE